MKYKKVLFVNPYYPHTRFGAFRPPTGLGYVAEALKRENIEYDVFDMALGYNAKALFKKIESYIPDLIAVSMMTYMYKNTYGILASIKNKFPDIKVVLGGAHVSTMREAALKECEAIDYGIVCEGEKTVPELCRGVDVAGIKGLLYRDGYAVKYNGDRAFETDLDSINFPTYFKFELDKYMLREIDLITSRGCPYGCIYCTVRLASGARVRMRSPAHVADEIEYWYKRGCRRLEMADDNFSYDKERVHMICDEIIRRKLENLKLRCGNGLRADKVDIALLKHMKDAGFCHIAFGVESGNDIVLQAMKKGETREILEKAINIGCQAGLDVTLFFIIGLPGETIDTVQDSFEVALKYPVLEAKFFNPIPYPKTELFRWAESNKLFLIKPEKYLNDFTSFIFKPVYETKDFSVKERIKTFKHSDMVRKGILKRSVRRKLKRYGPLAYIFAYLYTIPFIERAFRENVGFRKLVDLITSAREGA